MKIGNQKEVWDKIASKWSEYRRFQIEDLKAFLKDKKGNMLDLGCGSGRNFVKFDGKIYAVDFSEKMLEYARTKAKDLRLNANFYCNSADSLPFEDNYFDTAIFVAALHCIDSKESRKRAIKELYRVLKPGAQAFITVWSKNHDRIKDGKKEQLIPWGIENEKVMRFYYIYDKVEIEYDLKKEGFEILSSAENENIVIIVRK